MYKKLILLMALVLMSRGVQAACDRTGDQINVNCWDCAADDGTSVCEARLSGTTLTVSGTGEMKGYSRSCEGDCHTDTPWLKLGVEDVVIDEGISSIGNFAFEDISTIKSVSLPSTLLSIGRDAFRNPQLTNIDIPDSVNNIGGWAFERSGLTSIILPEGITTIGGMVFGETHLEKLVIPASVENLSSNFLGEYRAEDGQRDTQTVQALYCTAAQMEKCEAALVTNNSDFKPTRYEKEGNNYLVYDDKGNVVGKYANITALNRGTATETYKYDSAGHLTSIFDGNGQRTWGKKIYTVEEAMESTAKGDRFHVSLTYK